MRLGRLALYTFLALIVLALGLVTLPLVNGYSRWVERGADDFALAVTRNLEGFIGAMERLADLNLAELRQFVQFLER